jgi:uncharacterized membrane protein required for colicin V production
MLGILTLGVMLLVAYCNAREGLFSSVCMLVNTFLAGFIAFNLWEPAASAIESSLQRSSFEGYEDFLIMIGLFAVSLGFLRTVTNNLNSSEIELEPIVNQAGGGVVGLLTGYLISGFLICAMETLPWYQNFLGFTPYNAQEPAIRRVFPPDRVWLAMMNRAGQAGLSAGDDSPTFDADGSFESDFFRFRRYPEPPEKAGP